MKQVALSMTGYFDKGKKTRREQFLASQFAGASLIARYDEGKGRHLVPLIRHEAGECSHGLPPS